MQADNLNMEGVMKDYPVVIVCGGEATRLYPITKTIPKSLIEISGRAFISYQLELLKNKGVIDVILCVGKFGEMIEEYVGDGSKWGLKVRYSYDGGTLLGTGGAVKKAIPMLSDVFMVMYGDSYLDVDFKPVIERFGKEGKEGLMTIYCNENRWDKSNILFKDGQIVRYDKKNQTHEMKYIDYGLSVLRKSVFDEWEGTFDLSEVFMELIRKKEMIGVEVFKRFYECGSARGIEEFQEYIGLLGE